MVRTRLGGAGPLPFQDSRSTPIRAEAQAIVLSPPARDLGQKLTSSLCFAQEGINTPTKDRRIRVGCGPDFRIRKDACVQRFDLIVGQDFHPPVEATFTFFQRVVQAEDLSDLFNRRTGRWQYEECRKRGMIPMQLTLDLSRPSPRANFRKQNSLLDPDMTQQAAAKFGVGGHFDRRIIECSSEQRIESRVIAHEQIAKGGTHLLDHTTEQPDVC